MRWQKGHLSSFRARSLAIMTRMVAMEFSTWRSGRIGGASGAEVRGYRKAFDECCVPGG
jgi:hypothetical protein